LQAVKPWSTKGVEGVHRFLKRANKLITEAKIEDREMTKDEAKSLAKMVKKVGEDLEAMSFNTAISAMMVFLNETSGETLAKEAAEKFVLCLAPFAPHLGEELWEFLGHSSTRAYEKRPSYDPSALVEDEIEIPVQVLGKLRGRVRVPAGATVQDVEEIAMKDSEIAKYLEGKTIVKVIAVPKRMVNFVIR
jgi:leucyl-tRNA synthetase